jgi:hypothetical protein
MSMTLTRLKPVNEIISGDYLQLFSELRICHSIPTQRHPKQMEAEAMEAAAMEVAAARASRK